jgi:mercuric ion transport protein
MKNTNASMMGALGLGVLSSACCTLPLIAVAAGIGGTWATTFAWVEPFRWWFVGAAGLFLAVAVVKEVRDSRRADCDCEEGMSPLVRRSLLVVAVIMTAGFAMSPDLLKAESAPLTYETVGNQRVVLAVEGMTCETCTTTVRMILDEVEGAEVAEVTYEPPHATVDIDGDRVTSEQLVAAIQKIGYDASVVWEGAKTR